MAWNGVLPDDIQFGWDGHPGFGGTLNMGDIITRYIFGNKNKTSMSVEN